MLIHTVTINKCGVKLESGQSSDVIMCPSTSPVDSTHVLAIRSLGGKLKFLNTLQPLPEVARAVITIDDLQNRLRLTGPCSRRSCSYWTGFCSLAQDFASIQIDDKRICSIYKSCRWRIENGAQVCGVCQTIQWHSKKD